MSGVADTTAFLTRLLRLDPAAPVRVVPSAGRSTLWAPLPWDVLVTRVVDVELAAGTPAAAGLLSALRSGEPSGGADQEWRWSLPGPAGEPIEYLPAAEIRRVGAAAARTLREVAAGGLGGRAVGQRALRDSLLDHVAVTVDAQGQQIGVPQRLVQAVQQMGFVRPSPSADSTIAVRVSPGWVGLAAEYGTAWWHRVSRLTVTPLR